MAELDAPAEQEEAAEAAPAEVQQAEPVEQAEPAPQTLQEAVKAAGKEISDKAAAAGRDEKGKFTKPAKVAPAVSLKPAVGTVAKPAPAAVEPQVVAIKPPGSWTPGAREKWATLPPEIQKEIKRVEQAQIAEGQLHAPVKKFQAEFERVSSPYAATIAAEQAANGEEGGPLRSYERYLQTAHALRTSPPETRAQLIMGVCGSYGVPPGALIAHLLAAYRGDPAQLDAEVSERLQGRRQAGGQQHFDPEQLLAQAEARAEKRYEQREMQTRTQRATAEFAKFIEANEYAEDLREDMGKLMRAGYAKDFQGAYEAALGLPKNKEIADILHQREEAKAATGGPAGTVVAAKKAASTIKGRPVARPAPAASNGKRTIREDMMMAAEEIAGR